MWSAFDRTIYPVVCFSRNHNKSKFDFATDYFEGLSISLWHDTLDGAAAYRLNTLIA